MVFFVKSGGESAMPLEDERGVFVELSSLPATSSRGVEPVGVVEGETADAPVTPGKLRNIARIESAEAVFLPFRPSPVPTKLIIIIKFKR